MGTRADFYIGRGKNAQWIGSTAWDGYPKGIDLTGAKLLYGHEHSDFPKGEHLFDAVTEEEFRARLVQYCENREDVTLPEQGWPWPWENSNTTDYAYAYDEGNVWGTCCGHGWWLAKDGPPDDDENIPKDIEWPNMRTDRSAPAGSDRSGVMIFVARLIIATTAAFWSLVAVSSTQEQDNPAARLAGEDGRVPVNGLLNAYNHKKAMLFRAEAWSEFGNGVDVASWVSIGPGNVGGRIRSIIIHPTNPDTMWLGAVAGGVWKTTNGGASWSTNTDFLSNLAINCMVIDPTNPNVLYAGTGEGFFNNDAVRGYGIFKTVNGGATWVQLPATASADFHWVNRLAISPTSGAILAATRSDSSPGKILRSTDQGASWVTVLSGGPMNDVKFRPNVTPPPTGKKGIETPAVTCLAGDFFGQVYWSSNDGLTWNLAAGLPPPGAFQRVELAYSRSNPLIAYVSAAADGQLYRSTNGGLTFEARGGPVGGTGANWYNNALWVDPTNPDVVVVGGGRLSRTVQGGAPGSWITLDDIHADHHAIVEHPAYNGTTNRIIFDGNDGGISRTDDVLAAQVAWVNLNHNLAITQFYSGAGNASTGLIVGGTQDNGTPQYLNDSENPNWRGFGLGGDGGFVASDQTSPGYFYGEYIGMRIYRSNDGGSSAGYCFGGITDVTRSCDESGCYTNFISPFILDPNNPNTMLAGGRSLWRSNNIKSPYPPTWAVMKAPIPTGHNINAIAVQQGNSNVVWVAHNDGSVYRTNNGTASSPTWQERASGLPVRTCTRLAIGLSPDPKLPTRKYATFTGFYSDNVWMTEDNGLTWLSISNGLPEAPVNSIVISPTDPNRLYIGTEIGIFASPDGGLTWSPGPNGQPADVRVDELFWLGTKLVAATHGRGMFTIGN